MEQVRGLADPGNNIRSMGLMDLVHTPLGSSNRRCQSLIQWPRTKGARDATVIGGAADGGVTRLSPGRCSGDQGLTARSLGGGGVNTRSIFGESGARVAPKG
jgi:hypothetical protein